MVYFDENIPSSKERISEAFIALNQCLTLQIVSITNVTSGQVFGLKSLQSWYS